MKKHRITIFFIILVMVFYGLNTLLVNFESNHPDGSITNLRDAFWYMLVTLTTVGYGDFYPVSPGGRAIGYLYVLASLGILGFLFSTISNKIYQMMEDRKMGFQGTSFENHIIIIGWNEFSRMVAEEIYHTNKNLAIITNKKDDIDLIYEQFDKKKVFVLFSEYQNFESLPKVNAEKAAVVFINLEDDSEALMYVIDFKKRFPGPDIVVSLQKSKLKSTFNAAGVTYAVARSEIASKLVASYIFEPDVAEFNIDILSSSRKDEDYDTQEFRVTEKNPYLNKDYMEAFTDLKLQHDAVLLGLSKIKDGTRSVLKNPGKGVRIELGDFILLMGNGSCKRNLEKIFGVQEGRTINV